MIESGKLCRVSLMIDHRMRVDEKGLAHGGFTFGLADYGAMGNIPLIDRLDKNPLEVISSGDRVKIDGDQGTGEVIKKNST